MRCDLQVLFDSRRSQTTAMPTVVVNRPSNIMRLAKVSLNFAGVTVSFYKRLCTSCSREIFSKLSRILDFFARLR